ncbi:helix-turn-helix domain-containing protein [Mycobacterium sp.]|uniref:helix-turn-helix domain-containing protein n=1 Tax=Mycobacterium sp. TaxID=1785 RepID=UPI0034502762
MTRRLQAAERQLVELVSSDVTARVARQLVGADRVSVNKALRSFTTRGWISLKGKTVLIVNPEALAVRAGDVDHALPRDDRLGA